VRSLTVTPPLRVLGMVASPTDLDPLDVTQEKARVEAALEPLRVMGRADLTWLQGSTWRDVQRAMREGPWHIFHFVGHGDFDAASEDGVLPSPDETQNPSRLTATLLARLLADHSALRLVVLNACEGARSSATDVFSSTAATLVRRGIPAVLAMQHEIS